MNANELERLNGEQLLHTVWIIRDNKPLGIMEQTITDVYRLLQTECVVKIECIGGTLENKIRECERWGCE